jgi:hypothetical protein
MIKRNFIAALIAAGMFSAAGLVEASVLNLGSSGSGTVGGAIFQTNNDHPTGTGVYDPFLTIQNSPWEQGYNSGSNDNFDTKRVPQWNHEIKFSDLQATTINGVQYFGFSVDINEPGGNKSTISLDGLKIWTSSTTQNSTSTDANGFFSGSLGTLRFDLGNNQVLYDDQNTGSGGGDINIYVPVSNFAGAQANDFVYVYQRWGNSDASSSQGGFEETALIAGVAQVPEMSALFPIVGLLVAVGSTHVLRRRRAAQVKA